MKKILLIFIFLIIGGAGCKPNQNNLVAQNQLSSSTTNIQNSTNTPNDTQPSWELASEAKQIIGMAEYEVSSEQLFKTRNVLYFSLITKNAKWTDSFYEASETAIYKYDLTTKQVDKVISSKEVPKSLIFNDENPKEKFFRALPYLNVEGASLSPNDTYLQLKADDIAFGEVFYRDTIIVNLKTKKVKNIGDTSNFEWLGEKKFRYKARTPYSCNEMEVGPSVCFKEEPWKEGKL